MVCAIMLALSCSHFHVTREIREGSGLSQLKNSGILFRIPHNSPIPVERLTESLTNWLQPYKKINNLKIIEAAPENLTISKGEYDRFLQFSIDGDFQYNQAVGIITNYITKNKDEIEKIQNEYGLDSFIIYEVDSFLSSEMQVINFSSMIVILNAKYQILYMDHQFDTYNVYEIDSQFLKENLLDQMSNRFVELMIKMDYSEEI